MRVWILIVALSAAAVADRVTPYQSGAGKVTAIERGRVAPGDRVELTSAEINALAARMMPAGVRDPRITLGNGIATGTATVDFLRVHQARGERPGFLLRQLLDGERPVSVTARVRSRMGSAVVDLERVVVSGVEIEGRALDFLIRTFIRPNYPEARVGQAFALGYGIDHFEIAPSAVNVVIAAR